MPSRQVRLADLPDADVDVLHATFHAARQDLGIPEGFSQAALADAARAAAGRPDPHRYYDARDLDLVTIDPPTSRDLDQALHLARDGAGFVVHYAIADVAAFVRADTALDVEAHRRGVTVYGPDGRHPLHPPVLSEGAASLLPAQDRPACLWRLRLDADGEVVDVEVRRAVVRSRAKLSYEQVQRELDSPDPDPMLGLLAEVGSRRADLERARGGVSMPVPEQEVVRTRRGLALAFRSTLPVEGWNAQVSLATGMAAAGLMRRAGVGILRTLDAPRPRDLARLRLVASALGVPWPEAEPYADLIRRLDPGEPAHAALLDAATSLFRNAAYRTFAPDDGAAAPPGPLPHAAIAAEYAHVTAPLRRLVDRYGLEICLAESSGQGVPEWVHRGLEALPRAMARTTQRARAYENLAVDAVEAALLAQRVGEEFDGVIVDVDDAPPAGAETAAGPSGAVRGEVVIREPAVRSVVTGEALPLGREVRVRLTAASVPDRLVRFELA